MIEQSIRDAIDYSHFDASSKKNGGESDLDLSQATMFCDFSRGFNAGLHVLQSRGGEFGKGTANNSQEVVKQLRDLVERLVCDDSPQALLACEKLYVDLSSVYKAEPESQIRPFEQCAISPLSSVTGSVVVNQLLRDFNTFRMGATTDPCAVHTFTVSESRLKEVRTELASLSLNEEKGLHKLAGLLCHRYLGDDVTIEAQVYLKNVSTQDDGSSVILKHPLSKCELFSRSDLEIAESISARPAKSLGASVIEYRSSGADTDGAVHAVRTRIKAWDSLSDKVVDRMFEGNTITDLSGIAIVVDSEEDVRTVYGQLVQLRWSDAEFETVGLQPSDQIRGLDIFKTTDKLGGEHINWRGIKVAGFWGDH